LGNNIMPGHHSSALCSDNTNSTTGSARGGLHSRRTSVPRAISSVNHCRDLAPRGQQRRPVGSQTSFNRGSTQLPTTWKSRQHFTSSTGVQLHHASQGRTTHAPAKTIHKPTGRASTVSCSRSRPSRTFGLPRCRGTEDMTSPLRDPYAGVPSRQSITS
jgi:hypothetical protein